VNSNSTQTPRVAGQEIVSINPATLAELGRVPILAADEIERALAKARSVQPAWAALSFKDRARYILRAKHLLLERQDEICELIARETGKPVVEALASEVFPIENLMDYFARKSAKLLRDEQFSLSVFRNKKSRINFFPLGVVGIVSPWNFPFAIPMGEVVMGLMAGNAVLLKPSEHTPLVGLKIGELFRAAGLPEGILQVLTGDGTTGAALTESAIDKIFFTGSVRTGRKVAEAAAGRLMPFVLELGGKDAMIVCADAPFERTVNGALWGAFSNCGQACASVERLYVVESIAKRFISAVVEKAKTLRVGVDGAQQQDIGSLNNENQSAS
jgi:succinate-semialdehyde dehydrogenase/glutarate-semialdehyde dehydrogenase